MDIETKMLKYAAELHEDLRNYANLKDTDKPLLVAGILVALKERSFSIDDLVGEPKETDGEKLLAAIPMPLGSMLILTIFNSERLLSMAW